MSQSREPLPEGVPEAAAEAGLELRATLAVEVLPETTRKRLEQWLDEGRAGEMHYLSRAAALLPDPGRWKPWAGSILLTALPYPRPGAGFRGGGRVARYALGRDYHHVLGRRLERFGRRLRAAGLVARWRAVSDAAPLLEREWALAGGLGFRGKNTLVLDALHGPWILLGELLVDRAWEAVSAPPPAACCGSCTRCLTACPTDAFSAPWLLEPRRCVSYWTIEARGPIPHDLRPLLGDRVFGCDDCLEICPFGRETGDTSGFWGLHPALEALSLEDLLALPARDFDATFRGSPLRRAGWTGLLRNACVVLGNLGRGGPALRDTLAHHPDSLVRGHAAWALGRLGEKRALDRARGQEPDGRARAEIEAALARTES